jgi:hypothetical protein
MRLASFCELAKDEPFAAEIGEGLAVNQPVAGPTAENGNAARKIDTGNGRGPGSAFYSNKRAVCDTVHGSYNSSSINT